MATNTKKRKKTTASAAKKKTAQKKKSSRKKGGDKINKKTLFLLCAAVISIAALLIIVFTVKGQRVQNSKLDLESDIAWGIDVSSHNGKIDWNAVGESAEFAFIRIGYRGYSKGEINDDPKAEYNLKHANKNKVPIGVYFYSQAVNKTEAEEEADYLIRHIKGYDVSLPVVIDFEYAMADGKHTGRLYNAGLTNKERTALINAFCDKIRKAGYTPGIYASTYIYKTELNLKSIPEDVFIWVADYNKSITYDGYYDIWQYSDKGECRGVSSKNVDTNYFYIKNRL